MAAETFVTEALAAAMRERRLDAFDSDSPWAACLPPLLRALGHGDDSRELIEALPHFASELELLDIRNILVNLGYESSPLKTRADRIASELYPCLFVGDDSLLVICRDKAGGATYFDATERRWRRGEPPGARGTAYLFTQRDHAQPRAASGESWTFRLMMRFKHLLLHLLLMTGLINLVALAVPLFVMIVYDKVIGSHSSDSLPYMIAGISILLLADLLLRNLRARLLGHVAGRLDYLIGSSVFQQLLRLPPIYTERSTMNAQLGRIRQFDTLRDFFTGSNAANLLELPFALLFLGVIAVLAGPIVFVPIAMAGAYALFGLFWMPHLKTRLRAAASTRNNHQRMLMQTLDGRDEIKAVGGETRWWARFRELSGESVNASRASYMANAVLNTVSQALMTLAAVAVVGLGAEAVIAGEMSVGALIATMALVWRVLSPLQAAFLSANRIDQMLKAARQINQLMKLPIEKHHGKSSLLLRETQGHIRYERVSFRYAQDQNPALLGVSLEALPGEFVAITGGTGSGKSTLLKLIAGMYRPQAGSLSVDTLDLRQLNAIEWRQAIAYVPQETRLFHGSIAQNMRLNDPLASDARIERALDEAGILDDVRAMADGMHSRLDDISTRNLPPGVLRGLSMARAFLTPGHILLLDEPGASLDDASDSRFIEQIRRLKGRRTIIMVSHRPSHIRLADKAIVLEQGSIAFSGAPDEAIHRILEKAK